MLNLRLELNLQAYLSNPTINNTPKFTFEIILILTNPPDEIKPKRYTYIHTYITHFTTLKTFLLIILNQKLRNRQSSCPRMATCGDPGRNFCPFHSRMLNLLIMQKGSIIINSIINKNKLLTMSQ